MTGGTAFVCQMDGKTLLVGHRLFGRNCRKVRIHAGRRRWNVLTQEMLAHEQASAGRRRVIRIPRQRKEASVSQNAGARAVAWIFRQSELLCRHFKTI